MGVSDDEEGEEDTDSSSEKTISTERKKASPVIRITSLQTSKSKTKLKSPEINIVSSSSHVVPTVMTSLPTCVPLLVQDVNGQVFLLSTPNVQTSALGGRLFLPNTSSLELISPNQTIILHQ